MININTDRSTDDLFGLILNTNADISSTPTVDYPGKPNPFFPDYTHIAEDELRYCYEGRRVLDLIRFILEPEVRISDLESGVSSKIPNNIGANPDLVRTIRIRALNYLTMLSLRYNNTREDLLALIDSLSMLIEPSEFVYCISTVKNSLLMHKEELLKAVEAKEETPVGHVLRYSARFEEIIAKIDSYLES